MTSIRVARIYDAPDPGAGVRVLADRLWPRGVGRSDPRIGRWLREVAPSSELRRWYDHDIARYGEFVVLYEDDLAQSGGADALAELVGAGPVTLLTAAKDVEHGHLTVLARLLATR